MYEISAKDLDPTRPKYLIVFDDVSENNTSTLSTVLKKGRAEDAPKREGISILAAGETGVHTKVYENLGVAAADLSKAQHDALCKRSNVIAVVENEVRYLPPVRRTLKKNQDDPAGTDPNAAAMFAYLRGMRDAINLALAFQPSEAAGTQQQDDFAESMANLSPFARPEVNVAAAAKFTWALKAIGVAAALKPPTGRGVKVAVLDTGIDLKHPDLRDKVVEGVSAVSMVRNVTVQDTNGHGTHCAGVVCGPKKPKGGVRYGIAPDADLLVGKVFNNAIRPAASDDDILDGIAWAEQNGARVISMSLGSKRAVNGKYPVAYEFMVRKLLNRKSNSVLLVAAAGNGSDRPFSTSAVENPASCPSIMAVAATDRHNAIADFSCRKMDDIGAVDVAAPGVAVYSSFLNGGYEELDGTSMATPYVAGLAALYLERDPKLTARKLFEELQNRARPVGSPEDFGAGIVTL